MGKSELEKGQLPNVNSLQAQDVLEHLTYLKRCGKRGQTSQEICYHFANIISEAAVIKQLSRLRKWNAIKQIKIRYSKYPLILYEAN